MFLSVTMNVGLYVGSDEDLVDENADGLAVGFIDGSPDVGRVVFFNVGLTEIFVLRSSEGFAVKSAVGTDEGTVYTLSLGITKGLTVDFNVGY